MPIYEYQCRSCQHQFDAFQKTSDAPLVQCPECHQHTLEKLISAASFQLKGTGWYVTDFKDKKAAPNKESADKADNDNSSKKDKSDNNTETKNSANTAEKKTNKSDNGEAA